MMRKTFVHRFNHHYELAWTCFLLFLCQEQDHRMDEINCEGGV